MKFCCDKFRFFYSGEKSAGLNIRIVKLSKDYIERGNLKIDRMYFVTEGTLVRLMNAKRKWQSIIALFV